MKPQAYRLAGLAITAVLALAACGDDSNSQASADSSSSTTDLAAYCDASLAVEAQQFPDVDSESASSDEMASALSDFYGELRPLADTVVAAAPSELDADYQVLSNALDKLPTAEDDPFDAPEVKEAEERVHAFDLAHCGWHSQQIIASEYHFDGLAPSIDAGVVSFEFANHGKELHQLELVRVNDGVTETVDELLDLPEDQAMSKITPVGNGAFAAPGDSDHFVADLTPGRYVAACFIPVGTTGDAPPVDAPPHASQGMVAEFTVS